MAKYQNAFIADLDNEEDEKSYSEELAEQEGVKEEAEAGAEDPFKKRYGDLRRYMQQKDQQHEQELARLREELDTATKKQLKFPKTKDEIESWAKKYPEVASIVETIAGMKASEALQEGEKRMQSLKDMEKRITQKEAEQELLKMHPDFPDIREDPEFHEWVAEQPSYIQDALYKNNTDARAAARAIDLYKADTGKSKKKKKDDPKSAAASIATGGSSAPDTRGKPTFKESQVARMSNKEYEDNEDAILAAVREGRFEYDMTGAAR